MGYRDLHLFNLAMLGRQAWRMLENTESLCARLLKARYWPDGDLMQVQEYPHISYTWRSIVRGTKALEKELIWRVSDGQHIWIWDDPWLPAGVTRRPRTPRRSLVLNKVSDLIDPSTVGRDTQLVKDVFWEEDASLVLAIPTRPDQQDIVAWAHGTLILKGNIQSNLHIMCLRIMKRGEESGKLVSLHPAQLLLMINSFRTG